MQRLKIEGNQKKIFGMETNDTKKIRYNNNNTQKIKDEKSILMVAAPGWASPLDPRQCALCRRCAVSTTLTPRRLSSKCIDTKILSETLFGMLKSKVSDRQRFYGMPKDVSEIENYLKTFLRDSSKTSRVNHPLGPLLTAWYNEEYADEERNHVLIDTIDSYLTFSDHLGQIMWIHRDCAESSPDIRRDERETWYNVSEAVRNASKVKCVNCDYEGATIMCDEKSCEFRLHRHCALKIRAKSWRDYAGLGENNTTPVPFSNSHYCWKHHSCFSFHTVMKNRNENPLKFVGHEVEKDFGTQGKFVGIVWHFDPCAKFFNVVYEDGDCEEISLKSLIPLLVEDRLDLRLKRTKDLWKSMKLRLLTSTSPKSLKMLEPVIACFENAKFPIEGELYRVLRQSTKDLCCVSGENEEAEKMKVYEKLRKVMRARLKWWSKISSHLDELKSQIEMARSGGAMGEHEKLLVVLKPLWSYRSRLMANFQRELQSVMIN